MQNIGINLHSKHLIRCIGHGELILKSVRIRSDKHDAAGKYPRIDFSLKYIQHGNRLIVKGFSGKINPLASLRIKRHIHRHRSRDFTVFFIDLIGEGRIFLPGPGIGIFREYTPYDSVRIRGHVHVSVIAFLSHKGKFRVSHIERINHLFPVFVRFHNRIKIQMRSHNDISVFKHCIP